LEQFVRLYVIGMEGQVARALREAASENPDLVVGSGGRPILDILRRELIEQELSAFAPDLVINPAAYTAVDRAESERDLAFAVNRDGAANVAAIAARLGVPIIHLSTDYVFDGKKQRRYVETDSVAPLGVYGESKLAGEQAVAAENKHHVICRTSWVYAPFGNNFVRTIVRLSAERERLTIVDDQIGCPTYAPDIASAIISIARKIHEVGWQPSFAGVTHLAAPDEVSWCGFAQKIVSLLQRRTTRSTAVVGISTTDYPTSALRPANSRLCCDRLASIFQVCLPSLDASLERCMERLLDSVTSDLGVRK
jgi:dTDP-4-dehydrorhamnose reductase